MTTPIRIGSKVHVTNHGKGKVKAFVGAENQVVYVELENGDEVVASKDIVKRVEAEN